MKNVQILTATALTAGVLLCGIPVSAQELLFEDDFDADTSSSWTVFSGATEGIPDTDWEANFAWDYGAYAIPAAPNSDGETTLGLQFKVNKAFGDAYGLSAFPDGQHFEGDYIVEFDLWINFNGSVGPDMAAGWGPTTEHVNFGVGATGDSVQQWFNQEHLPNRRGAMFGMNGDGGSGSIGEYRAYVNQVSQAPADGSYLAGTDDSARWWENEYYHSVVPGGATVPDDQRIMQRDADPLNWDRDYSDLGQTAAGAPGFMWHEVAIEVEGDIVRWYLNDLLLVELTPETAELEVDEEGNGTFGPVPTDGNIHLGYLDQFSSTAEMESEFVFAVFDNLRVNSLPEAAGFASWAEANITDEGARGPGDNPSGDGIDNLLKYALGMNPAETSRDELPQGVIETDATDGQNYLTLTITRDPNATGVELIVEVSGDLENWDGAGATTILEDTEGTLKVRDNTPISAEGRRFIRVEAVEGS